MTLVKRTLKEKKEECKYEYVEKENDRKIKMQQMLSNKEYLNWLENFTIEHKNFFNTDWLYFPEKISDSDRINVENLDLLYNEIERYASENYIYPVHDEFGNLYKIKLNNIGYEIEKLDFQGTTLFFCNRVQIKNDYEFIDFNDIINNNKKDNTNNIKDSLKKLSNIVVSLYESGVPLEAISITLDNTLNEINVQREAGQSKILKK